jgi:hypothetical protein
MLGDVHDVGIYRALDSGRSWGLDAVDLLHAVPFRSRSYVYSATPSAWFSRDAKPKDASLRMRDGSFVSLGTQNELMAAYNLYHAWLKVCTVAVQMGLVQGS